jgi:hypothetical protein
MASEDYVLYAVVALIIVSIIVLVIYKTKQSDSFKMINNSKEEYNKAIKASKQPVKKETYTNITACPCSDTEDGCPMGCSCGKCTGEKFQHESEPPVVYTSINATGGGSSIKKDTRANSDPFRGDITITSPPSGHQTTQASFETSSGGKNIVFGA